VELTQKEIETLSREDLAAELSNAVYAATALLERMEDAGRILGNGHHKRQRVTAFAVEEMLHSWREGQ